MPTEPRSWQDWLETNSAKWLMFARQQTRSEADAEDVLQDALVKTWKTCDGEISDETTGLVFTNIRRIAIDRARSNQSRANREQQMAEETPQTEEAWFEFDGDNAAFAETVQKALAEIPDKFSEVVTLKIWSEMTFAQIAEHLDVAQNTVQSRYRYGLEKLKQLLDSKRDDLVA